MFRLRPGEEWRVRAQRIEKKTVASSTRTAGRTAQPEGIQAPEKNPDVRDVVFPFAALDMAHIDGARVVSKAVPSAQAAPIAASRAHSNS